MRWDLGDLRSMLNKMKSVTKVTVDYVGMGLAEGCTYFPLSSGLGHAALFSF